MSGKYDDILHLPHHVSPTRRRMTMTERAAQFSPFAALVGYEDAVKETGRMIRQRIELTENEKAALDQKQQIILAVLKQGEQPEVTVTYFHPDPKKEGGEYVDYTGTVKRIKEAESSLVFTDGTEIHSPDVVDLRSDLFDGCFDVS